MGDEQPQVELTTPNQTSTPEATGSEAAQTPQESAAPDLRVPLKEERQKRQELETSLNDPMFIYEQAKRLGLTEEDAQTVTEIAAERTTPGVRTPDVAQQLPALVKRELEIEKAKEKYPDLVTDHVIGAMVTSLMNSGMSPLKAADEIFARLGVKKDEKAQAEKAEQEAVEAKKTGSHTVTTSTASPAQVENDELVRRSRSWDSKEQSNAMIELLKRKNKEMGIL